MIGYCTRTGDELLFVGDNWAEAHHDVELMDACPGGSDEQGLSPDQQRGHQLPQRDVKAFGVRSGR